MGGTPFEAMYYSLDGNGYYWGHTQWSTVLGVHGPDTKPLYDTLWGIRMTQPVADGVDVTLTYARQELASAYSGWTGLDDVQLLVAGVVVPF